jgi:3'-phosphoadenosine 5'-phosphosulfate sulfotransferase (PAPS reductase)/FAD synthetase
MIHIVSFSTGLSSAVTVERVRERYGDQNTIIVFMDTTIEHEDNYRFMRELRAKRWGEIRFELLREGRSPYEVFRDQNVIPNHRVAPCTKRLKIQPFKRFLASLEEELTIHIGFDFTELHRVKRTREHYEKLGYIVDFPLLWEPIEYRDYGEISRADWGVEPPYMYKLGYSHANCGGLCIKQGQGDWIRTLINDPEKYQEIELWEKKMRDHEVRRNYAIQRTKKGGNGSYRPLTLEELRENHESENGSKEGTQLSLFDHVNCINCGVGL